MLTLTKQFRICQKKFRSNQLTKRKTQYKLKSQHYATLKGVFFSNDDITDTYTKDKDVIQKPPLDKLFESIGIELNFSDEMELGNLNSIEDLKEIVNDTNLWLSLNISPVKKAKIKNTLKVTPIPISESRRKFLSTESLDSLEMPKENAVFPFDIPATDTDHQYAIPLRLVSESIERVIHLLLNGKDCMLVGSEYKGKTTALHEMKDTILMNEPNVLPLYIDIKHSSRDIQFDFTKAIIHAMTQACGDFDSYDSLYKLPPEDVLERIVKDCTKGGKKLILFVDHLEELSWIKQMEILNDVLGLPRTHGQSSSKPYAVAIAGTETMWKELTFYDPAWKNYCYKEVWNPVFQNSHISALLKNIELYHYPLDSKTLQKIKTMTNGHPWYVNRLLHEIMEYTSYSSDPIELAANRLVKNMTLNGEKSLDFDIGYVFASIFASGCQTCNEHISMICTDKLGWFTLKDTPNGKIVTPTSPMIRESVAYTLSKNFCRKRNEVDSILIRMVDVKSPETIFKSWKSFVNNLCEFENSFLYFWQFMESVADANGLQIKHEWPQGKLVMSVQLQNTIQPGRVIRVTLVDDHKNKNNKEAMLLQYIIPEAQKVSENGLTSGTMFLPGSGKHEVLEIFGIEMNIFYEDNPL